MARTTVLLPQVALILCLEIIGSLATAPFLQLHRGHNWDDKQIVLLKSTPNLTTVDFNNQAHTYYLHGTVIMYDSENYNDANPGAEIINATFTQGANIKDTHVNLSMTSSVRILGYNSVHSACITLFGKKNFGGLREEIITANKAVLSYNDSVSLVNIGIKTWTFYDEINYNGKGDCVKGSSNDHGVRFLPNAAAIGFPLKGKRSVEIGCYARHGVPLVQD